MIIASTGTTAIIVTVAAGLVGAGLVKPSQPMPLRVRVRRGLRAIRRR